ncbi:MAG: phage portal protein [Acidobacteria bacterium]|nr:phage portal protein [Acidobacteriota bacterium]
MSIFDWFKARKPEVRDKRSGFMLLPWEQGTEYVKPDDMGTQVKANTSWVYIAANKNATAFANVPLRLYVAKRSAGQKLLVPTKGITPRVKAHIQRSAGLAPWIAKAAEIEEVQEHPFLELLKNVNAFTNSWQLLFDTDLFQELTGNSYWYIVRDNLGLPAEIWSLPSQYMSIIPDAKNYIGGYKWKRGTVDVFFEPQEIIHFKLPNPNNLYYGMSPLQAVRQAYNIQANMDTYQNAVFSNDGRLAGAFETDSALTEGAFTRLKEQVNQNFRGAKNAGKIPVLESGLHYKEYSLAPKELDFLNGRKWAQEEIVDAFGQTLALYDKNTTRANSETALYLWMAHTIAPRHRMVEQKINEQLLAAYDPSLFVAFDDCVPEDKEFALKERQTNIQTGYMTINELRAREGLKPVPWGDEPPTERAAARSDEQAQMMADAMAEGGREDEDEDEPAKSVKKKTFRHGGPISGMRS